MGQPSSIFSSSSYSQNQSTLLLQQLSKLSIPNIHYYKFISKKSDDTIIIQNIQNYQYYQLRTLVMTVQEDLLSFMKMIQKRNRINCIHLCKIVQVKKQKISYSCSNLFKAYLLVECPIKTLREEFDERRIGSGRKKGKEYFYEEELWGMAYSLIKSIKSLYLSGVIHQSLSLDCMYIDQKGLIKLADPSIFGLQKNYINAMKQKQNCKRILSPQILIFLQQFNFYFYQKQKSDIFIVGIILLQLSTLNQFMIYDYRQRKSRFQVIQNNLNQIKNKYSYKYFTLIEWMTHIEPKKRPRCSELVDFIDKNNNDVSTTSMTNTVRQSPTTEVPTVIVQRNQIRRQITPSAFSLDHSNNSHLQTTNTKNSNCKFYYYNPDESNNINLSHNNINLSNLSKIDHVREQTPINFPSNKTNQIIKQSPTVPVKTNAFNSQHSSSSSYNVFPFQLVYNRIINNNDNMKKFQIQDLYKDNKIQGMFSSSCRGSIPTSSFHANVQRNYQLLNNKSKNGKLNINDLINSSKQQRNNDLIYSNQHSKHTNIRYNLNNMTGSSKYQNQYSQSKRQISNNIKLIQSNHVKINSIQLQQQTQKIQPSLKINYKEKYHKQQQQNSQYQPQNNHRQFLIVNQQQSQRNSPYRILKSIKSGQLVQEKIYSTNLLDIQPIIFKNQIELKNNMDKKKVKEKQNQSLFYKQSKESIEIFIEHNTQEQKNNKNSQQYINNCKNKTPINIFQSYQSQILKYQNQANLKKLNLTNLNNNGKYQQSDENYDKYLLADRVLNKQLHNKTSYPQSSKHGSLQSGQFSQKNSHITPKFMLTQNSMNFTNNQNSNNNLSNHKKIKSTFSDQFSKFKKQDSSQKQLEDGYKFVQNQLTQQGDIYTGFKNKQGLKQKQGRLEFHDGGYYKGQWKNDKMQGYGQIYYLNGSLAYKGQWKQGCFSGQGMIFNDTPEMFSQTFDYKKFTNIQNKWYSYQGQFQNDAKHGKGRIYLTNNEYFQGNFDYDMIEGPGTFYKQNGLKITGVWKDNQFIEEV